MLLGPKSQLHQAKAVHLLSSGTRTYGIVSYSSYTIGSSTPSLECGCPSDSTSGLTCVCTFALQTSVMTLTVTCSADDGDSQVSLTHRQSESFPPPPIAGATENSSEKTSGEKLSAGNQGYQQSRRGSKSIKRHNPSLGGGLRGSAKCTKLDM